MAPVLPQVVLPLAVLLRPSRRRRRLSPVSCCAHTSRFRTQGRLLTKDFPEAEESDEDMGFGLFD